VEPVYRLPVYLSVIACNYTLSLQFKKKLQTYNNFECVIIMLLIFMHAVVKQSARDVKSEQHFTLRHSVSVSASPHQPTRSIIIE